MFAVPRGFYDLTLASQSDEGTSPWDRITTRFKA
jgi:hypothetical protein